MLDQTTESLPLVQNRNDWWKGAVIYQIYPRSFQDTDGDGIGDLNGILNRLPYVRSLGVDAIWISPFFRSPMHDFGYDVSDYRDVDPLFGSLEIFDELVRRAHSLGLKVLIDLVFSHTSDCHPWFVQSRSSRNNPKADWYVWADPNPDGTPPNNWLSVFGGTAWEWETGRGQYFLHNFLATQPDLNFHNAEVREELLDVMRFWLRRGVDGFRLDTVNFYFCDAELRSNPALPDNERSDDIAPKVNPYNFQRHIYDKNRPENLGFLRAMRGVLDGFGGRLAMGEVGDAQRGLEIMSEYTSGDGLLHSCYAFDLLSGDRISAERVAAIMHRFNVMAADSWATWAFSNHDVVRHATRWGLSEAAQKTVLTLLICLRGSVCLFQGEELGLTEAQLNREELRDPYGIRFWPRFRGRDGCRTPMVWDASAENGGFSDVKPWLPVPEGHRRSAVTAQDSNSDSILAHYRKAIQLRRDWPVLKTGGLLELRAEGPILSFHRGAADSRLYCAFNLGDEEKEVSMPDGNWSVLFGTGNRPSGGALRLEGWSCVIAGEEIGG
ncbi:MAG: alpha-amylase family glycosyl hydrolase [Rhodobacteraceae bacterium]|nr:alpha-amylase family glycosyl hydrolase [Paracoccaceae bacterium]